MALALLITGFLVTGNAFGQTGLISKGFLNGHDFREMGEHGKHKYLIGMYDGIFLSPFYGASNQNKDWNWYLPCATRLIRSSEQLKTIIDNYLNAHPEKWNDFMNTIFFFSMKEACGK